MRILSIKGNNYSYKNKQKIYVKLIVLKKIDFKDSLDTRTE